jgi:hypothetical protein
LRALLKSSSSVRLYQQATGWVGFA